MFASTMLLAVLLIMLVELRVSHAHTRTLLTQGAVEARDDVYRAMAWTYPLIFVAMTAEALIAGSSSAPVALVGAAVLVGAKALKFWAISSLGIRWTYRVLVIPGAPLVTRGPYAHMRHPNYVAVIGE